MGKKWEEYMRTVIRRSAAVTGTVSRSQGQGSAIQPYTFRAGGIHTLMSFSASVSTLRVGAVGVAG